MKKQFRIIILFAVFVSCMDTVCQVNVFNNSKDKIEVIIHYDSAGLVKWYTSMRTANAYLTSVVPGWQNPGRYDSVSLKSFFIVPFGGKAIISSENATKPNWVYVKEIEIIKDGNKQLYGKSDFEKMFKKSDYGMYVMNVE